MYSKTLVLNIIFVAVSCDNNSHSLSPGNTDAITANKSFDDENPYATINEIPLPGGFKRVNEGSGSFSTWLNKVTLKKNKTVYIFDGTEKFNQAAQFAVLDITVGKKDLQQCADAVMRLRAEYLFANRQYQEIRFTDNEGKVYAFHPPFDYYNLTAYLNRVFGMCGSASLSKQLKRQPFNSIKPGDVLIRGGFPGHAVIVMSVASNQSGKKIYLLAQSYMPAQDIHVLTNPVNEKLSPWYEVDGGEVIETPEYNFTTKELKTW